MKYMLFFLSLIPVIFGLVDLSNFLFPKPVIWSIGSESAKSEYIPWYVL